MKIYQLLLIVCLLSCTATEQSEAQQPSQLLKDVEVLSSDAYQGRKTETKGAEMARSYLSQRFKALGLKSFASSYEQPFSFRSNTATKVTGTNMIGYIPGKTDQVIVISAHYDHLGMAGKEIYSGADDNASGVAGLLYIAEFYSKNQPNNTIIFAAFDAEEMGLRGAKAFLSAPPVSMGKIKLNINMDMISHNDKGELYACGTFKHPELKRFIITAVDGIKVLTGHDDPKLAHDDWTNQSDQGPFNAKGIPFLYFGVEDHRDYHQISDKYANINPVFFTKAARAILDITINIDKQRDIQQIFKEKLKMKKR
ncbi:MAG: M28 family peptidase [Bacteroidota bacterium]